MPNQSHHGRFRRLVGGSTVYCSNVLRGARFYRSVKSSDCIRPEEFSTWRTSRAVEESICFKFYESGGFRQSTLLAINPIYRIKAGVGWISPKRLNDATFGRFGSSMLLCNTWGSSFERADTRKGCGNY